jgi:hypothetical protein
MENTGKMIVDNSIDRVRKWENNTTPSVMRKREARTYFGVTDKTLQNWRDAGILKPYKVGGVVYYRLRDVEGLFNLVGGE